MRIVVRKVGGLWRGSIEGRTDIDEPALTEDMAHTKVQRIIEKWKSDEACRPDAQQLKR
jgi:hypothetical protein